MVTDTAVVAFRGASQPPHSDRDFVDYRNAREIAARHRNQLDEMIERYYTVRAQAPAKQNEGATHQDRDGQFRYLNDLAGLMVADGQPVISVDW